MDAETHAMFLSYIERTDGQIAKLAEKYDALSAYAGYLNQRLNVLAPVVSDAELAKLSAEEWDGE